MTAEIAGQAPLAALAAGAEAAIAASRSAPLRISILGATGHVGRAAIDLIAAAPHAYRLVALTSNYEIGRLESLIGRVGPELVIAADGEAFIHLRDMLRARPIEIGAGDKAMATAAARPADLVVVAVPGLAGLPLAFAAAAAGSAVAIADPRVAAMSAWRLPAAGGGRPPDLLGGPAAAAIDFVDGHSETKVDAIDLVFADELLDDFGLALQLMAITGLRPVDVGIIHVSRGSAAGALGSCGGQSRGWRPANGSHHEAVAQAIIAAATGRSAAAAPRQGVGPAAERVDEQSLPMLHLARQLIRRGPFAPVAYCAAYDVAVSADQFDGIGVHDIAAVVAETVDTCISSVASCEKPDVASLEQMDMAARALAYDLLDRFG